MPDIQIPQGDTYIFDVFATRNDEAVDLTDAKVWFTMKRNRRDLDDDAIIQHDTLDGSQQVRIVNVAQGIIRIKIIPSETVDLSPSYYPFDVQVLEADNTITTIESGFVQIDRASTNALT